jgi:Cu-Zn family superoxide dismutase
MSSEFGVRRLTVLVAAAVLTAGCGSGGQAPAASGSAAASAVPSAGATATAADETETGDAGPDAVDGTLAAPDKATNAFTYNPALAPEGADLSVDVETAAGTTEVALDVEGLLPNRGYAAHAHVNPCGATGDAAGPHFQNQADPAAAPGKPSTDPAYANPQNEIWLDLRTDGDGAGEATATVPFLFTDRAPASIVIHEAQSTATTPGQAGSAGARIACITVPFKK